MMEVGERLVPREYVDFQLCRELHCLPKDLEDMDETSYQQLLGFMRAEGYAAKMKADYASFRSKNG